MSYEYRKLRGRIVEKYGSIKRFSEAIKCSTVSVSKKINGKTSFSQQDMDEWARALEIPVNEYIEYFFA